MPPVDAEHTRNLIADAGLDEVFAAFPEDVAVAMKQAAGYNEAVAALDIPLAIPGSGDLPGAGR